ncbi:hypothetical protein, variant [Capsaspora owczarzaki ATCC 30864]|uniref:Uncharacterized protein n=1 Tax=Capsaspora owczarzaki (strain ATCC 30864) TaxID=595528 RepID=A0A0D2VLK1_CAPO3|nr:hypothetical protein, variant [Capsaspora owczarzaki ATCC 30864]
MELTLDHLDPFSMEIALAHVLHVMLASKLIETRVWGMFTLYALYNGQLCNPKVCIRVPITSFPDLVHLRDTLVADKLVDALYTFEQLEAAQAFLFTATASRAGLPVSRDANKALAMGARRLTSTYASELSERSAVNGIIDEDSIELVDKTFQRYFEAKCVLSALAAGDNAPSSAAAAAAAVANGSTALLHHALGGLGAESIGPSPMPSPLPFAPHEGSSHSLLQSGQGTSSSASSPFISTSSLSLLPATMHTASAGNSASAFGLGVPAVPAQPMKSLNIVSNAIAGDLAKTLGEYREEYRARLAEGKLDKTRRRAENVAMRAQASARRQNSQARRLDAKRMSAEQSKAECERILRQYLQLPATEADGETPSAQNESSSSAGEAATEPVAGDSMESDSLSTVGGSSGLRNKQPSRFVPTAAAASQDMPLVATTDPSAATHTPATAKPSRSRSRAPVFSKAALALSEGAAPRAGKQRTAAPPNPFTPLVVSSTPAVSGAGGDALASALEQDLAAEAAHATMQRAWEASTSRVRSATSSPRQRAAATSENSSNSDASSNRRTARGYNRDDDGEQDYVAGSSSSSSSSGSRSSRASTRRTRPRLATEDDG